MTCLSEKKTADKRIYNKDRLVKPIDDTNQHICVQRYLVRRVMLRNSLLHLGQAKASRSSPPAGLVAGGSGLNHNLVSLDYVQVEIPGIYGSWNIVILNSVVVIVVILLHLMLTLGHKVFSSDVSNPPEVMLISPSSC